MSSFTGHGGRLAEARAHYGGAADEWLDLSTGINPCPWPGQADLVPDWQRLPDPRDLARLEVLAAGYFGVASELCCAVPGSELGLRLLADLLALPGCHVPPCYGSHAGAFTVSRAVAGPEEVPLAPHVTVLANPNNPDGTVHDRADLRAWLEASRARDGWLVVDEAFADAQPALSVAPWVEESERLIVLRSFGKFFGLAGARLGFVLAPVAVLARLRQRLGDWPISAGALDLGLGAYADAGWIADMRAALPARATALDAVLRRHGLRPFGSCSLFRLVESDDAGACFESLARGRILTRPFADRPTWLRFGLPADEAELARLDATLAGMARHG